jgi:hypothetical protein
MAEPDPVITPALEDRAQQESDDGLLDVVVELVPDSAAAPTVPAKRESFESAAAPVEVEISRLGGAVTGKAWINRTLRAQVPASRLSELSASEYVTALDVPHQITAE